MERLASEPEATRKHPPSPDTAEARADLYAWQDEGIAPGIVKSRHAFLRDLPSLLQNPKYDRWAVAYCGDEQIALHPSEREVIRECIRRGLKDDEYYLGSVEPYDHDYDIEPRHDPLDE